MFERVNRNIRRHSLRVGDWPKRRLAEFCYRWFDRFNRYFFRHQLPPCVLSFERSRHREYGYFVPGRNGIGCKYNINISPDRAYESVVELLDTLIHEMTHGFEFKLEDQGKRARRKHVGNYHTEFFRAKMLDLGIRCTPQGITVERGNPFIAFLRKHGIRAATKLKLNWPPPPVRGGVGSKLKKWVCKCGYGVRVAIDFFRARCLICRKKFRRAPARRRR